MMFNPNAPVDARLIGRAQTFERQLPSAGGFDRGHFHWAVSTYTQRFPEYNGMVWFDGTDWQFELTHDPRDNATASFNPDNYAGHTYRRNRGAFGVSMAAMLGASYKSFGAYPATETGIDAMCAMMAAFCRKYGVQTNVAVPGKFYRDANEHSLMTHMESALWTPSTSNGVDYPHYYTFKPGGDPDSRWDWNLFSEQSGQPTEAQGYITASLLRQRTHVIAMHL